MPRFPSLKTGGGPVSQQSKSRCFQWVTDLETVQASVTIKYPAYREISEHDVHHVVLGYLASRDRLADLDDRLNHWT
ncbi:hypothetical protein TNCV_1716851 [Trichonephila clavipes]|nr:hypothetical protein TNCV_1716851 [Trichonephila clavipes]